MESANGGIGSLLLQSSKKKVDLVIDLQYGSTGKGLICGYLGHVGGYDTAISANMPNAGHTYIRSDGAKFIFKVLPSSAIGPDIRTILIGPGAVFDPAQLIKEIQYLRQDQTLRIHPNAVVLLPEHKNTEQKRLRHIASTAQGSAAAVIDKMWRTGAPTAKHALPPELMPYLCRYTEWMMRLSDARKILAEGSQGYSLGINTHFYPYTTSRDCTPAAFLSNMGIPVRMLDRVIGTCRTLPIRVGGTSGDCYADQEELSWGELGMEPELTTVTQRVRRIFTYSKDQIEEAAWYCNPDLVFLNFANYVSKSYVNQIVAHIDQFSNVKWIGFGPNHDDIGEV